MNELEKYLQDINYQPCRLVEFEVTTDFLEAPNDVLIEETLEMVENVVNTVNGGNLCQTQ